VIRAIGWNLYHGRDRPPDPSLFTWRSRLLRIGERNATHVQVNRDLLAEFAEVLSTAEWDVALLQECPPRWVGRLAAACGAEAQVSLTSRNSLAPLRSFLARLNPDLVASAEGGSNVILARQAAAPGDPAARRELVLTTRPERRTMVFARLASGLAVANLHASNAAPERAGPEVTRAAESALEWAGATPLILGGDFNLRPDRSPAVFDQLGRLGFSAPSEPDAIDHLLARGLDVVEPPARWPPERREVDAGGLAIRLSDHAPVSAAFA
jgi:endonuclease/exonuclease/phosphatase family metal-dependent hydrolase